MGTSTLQDFQTIESILKRSIAWSHWAKVEKFPDYWVYFKAWFGWFFMCWVFLFPDYWVYFKAIWLYGVLKWRIHYFQTIESILKLDCMNEADIEGMNFQTIESILKLVSSAAGNRMTRTNFQTIESILKHYPRNITKCFTKWFPDYWVYFKAWGSCIVCFLNQVISRLLSLF